MTSVLVSRKRLVYLRALMAGTNIVTMPIWAIEIDTTFPWAGAWTYRQEDASAFTYSLAMAINNRLKKYKMPPLAMVTAPKEYDGTIWFLKHVRKPIK